MGCNTVILIVVLLLFGFIMLIIGLVRLADQGTSVCVKDDCSTDGRHLNGKPLISDADWDLWWVMKGMSDGYSRHLNELEHEIEAPSAEHPEQALTDWMKTYEKYRSLCLKYGIWNAIIGDRQPFTASSSQRLAEEEVKRKLRLRFEAAAIPRAEYRRQAEEEAALRRFMLDALPPGRGSEALRHEWMREVCEKQGVEKSELWKVYRKMLRDGFVAERADGNHYLVKKRNTPCAKDQKKPPALPASVFVPGNYVNLTRKDRYKVLYTVGIPENIDRVKNTCEFVSLTSGERYRTSLQKCTCPAFSSPLYPCKHMITLAVSLGYLKEDLSLSRSDI